MMVLAVSHNTGDPTAHLHAEATRLAELQQAGLVELMLLKADWSGAVLLLRTSDLLTEVITPGSANHTAPAPGKI